MSFQIMHRFAIKNGVKAKGPVGHLEGCLEAQLGVHLYFHAEPLAATPPWLYSRTSQDDILEAPFTPSEIQCQLRRAIKNAPGADNDKLTYSNWKWADPDGAILSTSVVPPNTIYKLYSGAIARRIADWAISSNAILPTQKGFLPYDWGVKQGCPLSSLLFNIALEGLLRHLASCNYGYRLNDSININHYAYADDICVIAGSRQQGQALLDKRVEITTWAGLIFNPQKCGSICSINNVSPIYVDPTPLSIWAQILSSALLAPKALGGLGVPCCEDEMHVARASQAFKFLADTRDPTVRSIAILQLKKGRYLTFPQYRFALRALLNLLPTRTVQARSSSSIPDTRCRCCHLIPETLSHIINHCHHNLGLVKDRHNTILERVIRAIPRTLSDIYKEQPLPNTSGANRPDLTIISPDGQLVILLDVSIPFEGAPDALQEVALHKINKYEPLRQTLLQRYDRVEILPFLVGSLGVGFHPMTKSSSGSTLCDYVNANLRATSSHYKSTHGAAVPPVDIDGSIEKEEGRPSPPPVPTSEGMTLTLQRTDQMLSLLRPNPITRWEPEAWTFSLQPTNLVIHTGTPPQAAVLKRQHLGLGGGGGVAQPTTSPPAVARQPYKEEGNPSPTSSASRPQLAAEALAILELDSIVMWVGPRRGDPISLSREPGYPAIHLTYGYGH
eukprot:Em0007g1188a